jgi:hypothetical protein
VTIVTPIGNLAVVLDITDKGGQIGGTASTDDETVDFVNAVADGNRLTWSQDVTTPMRLTLQFDVTVEGDAMTGAARPTGGMLPASKVEGSRASAS